MTNTIRIPSKRRAASNDPGAYSRTNRPPTEWHTPELNTLLTELDQYAAAEHTAAHQLRDLNDNWESHERAAKNKDIQAGGEALRSGKNIKPNAAVNALHKQRTELEEARAAAQAAHTLTLNDLNTLRGELAAPNLEAITKQRETVHNLINELSTALDQLNGSLAMHEWVQNHIPYDRNLTIPVSEIWPPLNNYGITGETSIAQILDALARI